MPESEVQKAWMRITLWQGVREYEKIDSVSNGFQLIHMEYYMCIAKITMNQKWREEMRLILILISYPFQKKWNDCVTNNKRDGVKWKWMLIQIKCETLLPLTDSHEEAKALLVFAVAFAFPFHCHAT